MHMEMVLILFATLAVAQIVLVQWKKHYHRSYQVCALKHLHENKNNNYGVQVPLGLDNKSKNKKDLGPFCSVSNIIVVHD